jgi:hypothetical protein
VCPTPHSTTLLLLLLLLLQLLLRGGVPRTCFGMSHGCGRALGRAQRCGGPAREGCAPCNPENTRGRDIEGGKDVTLPPCAACVAPAPPPLQPRPTPSERCIRDNPARSCCCQLPSFLHVRPVFLSSCFRESGRGSSACSARDSTQAAPPQAPRACGAPPARSRTWTISPLRASAPHCCPLTAVPPCRLPRRTPSVSTR